MSVLFKPNPECPWVDGIEIPETLTIISRASRVTIQVHNTTKHKVVVKRRTVLGWSDQPTGWMLCNLTLPMKLQTVKRITVENVGCW